MVGDAKAKMTEAIRAAAKDAGTLLAAVAALAALALGVGLAALLLALRTSRAPAAALWPSRRPIPRRPT